MRTNEGFAQLDRSLDNQSRKKSGQLVKYVPYVSTLGLSGARYKALLSALTHELSYISISTSSRTQRESGVATWFSIIRVLSEPRVFPLFLKLSAECVTELRSHATSICSPP
jgi:hypothetical protein